MITLPRWGLARLFAVLLTGLLPQSALAQPPGESAVPTATPPSGSDRNLITRDRLQQAAAAGLSLGQFLAREVPGMRVRPTTGVGSGLCLEFRMLRGDEVCRPPQVFLDGAPIMSSLALFESFSPGNLEQIQLIPPSGAGTRFGNQSGWGVLLLQTQGADAYTATGMGPPQGADLRIRADWNDEDRSYPWGRVYAAAFVGNAAGLAGGVALMSQCMDMEDRRLYRNERHCGYGMLAFSGIALAFLPSLGGSAAAHLVGATGRSSGRMLLSTMAAQALLIPGFALASQVERGRDDASVGEVAGLLLMTVGAPLVNTVADRLFRDLR